MIAASELFSSANVLKRAFKFAGWQGAANDRPTPSASGVAKVSQDD